MPYWLMVGVVGVGERMQQLLVLEAGSFLS